MEEIEIELAWILAPDPERGRGDSYGQWEAQRNRAIGRRKVALGHIRGAIRHTVHQDPVIALLEELAARKRRADEEIRLVLAYARKFAGNGPYRLANLANAAGLSVSGVRTAFSRQDEETVRLRLPRA